MIYPIRSIVAGVADLDAEDPVLRESIALANRTGARLHLVHTYELPSLAWDAYGRMGYVSPETLEEHADSLRSLLGKAAVARGASADNVEYHLLAAPAAVTILEVAKEAEADLVIVGATRHGSFARLFMGTTAQRVLHGATMPVLVVRGEVPSRCERVLLTTDLSPFSAGVHELGLDVLDTFCGLDDSELRALLVVQSSLGLPVPFRLDQLEAMAGQELRKFLDQRRDRGVAITPSVRFGEPAHEITHEAAVWEPDLVIVGTHSRKATERWLLGSVAEATIRGVQTNVLVIPAVAEVRRKMPTPRHQTMPVPPPAN